MNLKERGFEDVYWIHLPQDKDQQWALVKTVINLQFPHIVGNLLTSGVVTAFSRRTEFGAWYLNGMYMRKYFLVL